MAKNKTYNLIDRNTKTVLSANCTASEAALLKETYEGVGYSVRLQETASGGSTGGGAIAVNFDSAQKGDDKFASLKKFMNDFNSRVRNSTNNKPKKDYFISVNEDFDLNSVFSRLAGMEQSGKVKKSEGTTFGIEDDKGNLMKVTVRAEQATDFEAEVADYIADIKANLDGLPMPKNAKEVSMAEILFKLKDKFDIIDVEFPKIPTDVVYNADDASVGVPATDTGADPMGMDGDMEGMDGDAGGMGDEMELGGDTGPMDLTDYKENPEGDMEGMDGEVGGMGDEMEDDLASDFSEPTDETSILDKVIGMLKSQAEAETEKAKAQGEQAKAEQARYTAQAKQSAMRDQEDEMRYELEMDEEKRREKESRKMADMAKHKLSKTLSAVSESDEGMSSQAIMRQRQQLSIKYKIEPGDSAEMRTYKNLQKSEAMREFTSKYRQALNREKHEAIVANNEKSAPQANQPTQQQQQQNQQQRQQQQGGPNQQTQRGPNMNPQQMGGNNEI